MSNANLTMANAIRFLTMDAVEAAKSGHPGAPMGMAEMAEVLWCDHLNHNPNNPNWANRDRFVLSNGHGSMLIYALLHLTGYNLAIEDIKAFRQLGSRTPGHPEVDITPGVETTTGPLGQGFANAVGMALAERLMAAEFNTDAHTIVDHFTYVFLGDGCLMEGISHEAASLAGTLKLAKLIALYDDNGISIDGRVADWFADDTPQRFRAYGWNVIDKVDGHDRAAISAAITAAKASDAPTLICCKTTIGQGAPTKAGGDKVHGAPLGADEITAARKAANWPHAPFDIPEAIYRNADQRTKGAEKEAQWQATFDAYAAAHPANAHEFVRRMAGDINDDTRAHIKALYNDTVANAKSIATRKASQDALNALAPFIPELFGGSADLTTSNLTKFDGAHNLTPNAVGHHLSYGVREFAMAAIMNGITLHGGFIPYGGTFLTFSDYSRNAIRMAALMKRRVIHVLTHDSIGLGEDGPTHQAVEHTPSLRLIPNLNVWRPADALETLVAWEAAVVRADGPTALVLSRQSMPALHTDTAKASKAAANIAKGGYVLRDVLGDAPHHAPNGDKPTNTAAILLATGSEVALALIAQTALHDMGIATRVVSMPCSEAFLGQTADYRTSVLNGAPIVAIEAAEPTYWYRFISEYAQGHGTVIGMTTFGESAPADTLYAHFNITVEAILTAVKTLR